MGDIYIDGLKFDEDRLNNIKRFIIDIQKNAKKYKSGIVKSKIKEGLFELVPTRNFKHKNPYFRMWRIHFTSNDLIEGENFLNSYSIEYYLFASMNKFLLKLEEYEEEVIYDSLILIDRDNKLKKLLR